MKFNIDSKSTDWRARFLSNFHPSPFELDGIRFASVEGFIQGIKFPEDDPRREQTFQLSGFEAKRIGRGAQKKAVWWQGEEIPYRSREHLVLLERAIRAKFAQNIKAKIALWATGEMELTHDLGHPENLQTSLPAREFIRILCTIRDELQEKRK